MCIVRLNKRHLICLIPRIWILGLNPPSYSGATTLPKFENFITELLQYLRVYRLLVDRLDHLRIQILGLTLTGDASKLFNQMVDTPK
jgi:hypothetical protein